MAIDEMTLTFSVNVNFIRSYRISYLINYNGFFNINEMTLYNIQEKDCDKYLYYIGEMTDYNLYRKCNGKVTVSDTKVYAKGDKVKLTNFSFKNYELN